MIKDLILIFDWWLMLLGLGLIFLPLTRKVFASFFDQGYLFSKVLALLFSSYLVWLLSSLKILPFYQETIWLVIILGIVANLWFSKKFSPQIPASSPTSHFPPLLQIFVSEELLFLFALLFWSFIRGFQPDIQGLEKFMDYGFINSILRSKYFPPADMWFAGKAINYYYYGHYLAAFLTKLSGISSAITYNLMIATVFSFCFSLTFSLTANLIHFFQKFSLSFSKSRFSLPRFDSPPVPESSARQATSKSNFPLPTSRFSPLIIGGLISALLISLGANLHPGYYNFKMKILGKPYCNASYNYWYPDATRYIGYCPEVEDKTIHEFPAYSFVVADLHGHVSDIPFVLFFLASTLNLLLYLKNQKTISFNFSLLTFNLPISLTLAIMFMTNQWDYPIYLMVLGLTLIAGYYSSSKDFWETLTKAIKTGIFVVLTTIPFILPFFLKFEQIGKGIGFVWKHSLPHQLLILWGVPWFFGITFLIFLFKNKIRTGFKKESLIKFISKVIGVNIQIRSAVQPKPLITNYQLLITDFFILILLLASTILIIIPEIIYLKDIYIPSYHRANTMFKLTYQSFMMFSVLIGYILIRLKLSLPKSRIKSLLFTFYILLFTSLMIYPLYSITGYYGVLERKNYKGLYGLKFLERLYPDDYAAVVWLNKNVAGQPAILEAVGDSYTDYERISMSTGLPTIEGWLVHEWLWRGAYDEPGKRATEVQTIYETTDSSAAQEILNKYQIRYVIIGGMEKTKYPKLQETKFSRLGRIVFQQGTTKIYELK